jgi:ion channel
MAGDILSVLAGLALIVLVLNDIFQSVVVPRAVGRRWRISFFVWRVSWHAWPALAWKLYGADDDKREDFLAVFAPFMLVFLLFVWTAGLILGYGLIFWGLRAGIAPSIRSFGEALYFSGTSTLTIGFGDVVGRSGGSRFFSVLAAVSGFSTFSIVTAYLFLLFASFQTRETFVVTLGGRAGTPPSGINLLSIAGYSDTRDDLSRLMIAAQTWAAQLMDSHLAYPVLAFFRSSHDYESWVGALGTMLDAATLLMTTVDGPHHGQARLFFNLGRHATRDLARYFRVEDDSNGAGIERMEFDRACDRLQSAGYVLRERNDAWKQFADLRSTYAGHLNAMAAFFEIPPLQWIGDRGTIKSPHV